MTSTKPNIFYRYLPIQCYGSRLVNFHPKPLSIEGIVQHYFSGRWAFPEDRYNIDKCWQLMHDLNFEKADRLFGIYDGPRQSSSAHFLIGRYGEIWQLVPLEFQAWHAGVSAFNHKENCNAFMVGIENIGGPGEPYPDPQYRANAAVCRWLMDVYGFGFDMITGHDQVAVPEGRKKDPGRLFDYDKLNDYIEKGRN